MATAESIKRQIDTCQDLQSVVKTMKALAAVSIRQYEKAVESLAEYNRTIEMGLQIVLRNRFETRVTRQLDKETLGAVIFGSDQGMCGQFNDHIASHAIAAIEQLNVEPENLKLLAVGTRVVASLEAAGLLVEEEFAVPGSVTGITPLVQEVLLKIEAWQQQQPIHRILLFYNQPAAGSSYHPHTRQMLPIDREWLQNLQSSGWSTRALPIFTMAQPQLFSALIRQYFFVSLYRACAESGASENASRLASMQVAEKNIAERLEELNTHYQHERQTSITSELLDIVSGFEALTQMR